jgi:GTPase SAR1 family protein
LTNPESFERLNFWLNEVKQTSGDIPMVFVGNKADLRPSVNQEQIQNFALANDITYVETSAKTGMNAVKPFFLLAPRILERIEG